MNSPGRIFPLLRFCAVALVCFLSAGTSSALEEPKSADIVLQSPNAPGSVVIAEQTFEPTTPMVESSCESQAYSGELFRNFAYTSGGDVSMSDFCHSCADQDLQNVIVKKNVLGCPETIKVLPQDEVWLVSARTYLGGERDLSGLCVCRLENSQFVPSSLDQLTLKHASNDARSTVIYVHGNQTNLEYAISRGLQVYRNALTQKAQCRGGVRYVIWAWKSEQEMVRFYPDFLVKSERSVCVGETFAETLNRFPDRNMVLMGYSLGVQVVLSALDSRACESRPADATKYQVVFAAPALNAQFAANHGLCKNESPVAQTYVFVNRKDKAIKVAQAIVRRTTSVNEPTIEGLTRSGKLNIGTVKSIDVFDETGRFHSIERYTRSGTMQLTLASLVNEVASQRGAIVLRSGPTLATENPADSPLASTPVLPVIHELSPVVAP